MPKRCSDGLQGVGRKPKRRRRHLYVVMDDGEGYAVRKFDLSSDRDSSDDDDDDEAEQPPEQRTVGVTEQRLPRAIIRLDSPSGRYFAAIGTKIMVTHEMWPDGAVPVFDVRTRRLDLGPPPTVFSGMRCPTYLTLGDKLLSVETGSTELLHPPPPRSGSICSGVSDVEWSWHKLPRPPFRCLHVASCAAHPDGRTVFFGIEIRDLFGRKVTGTATFALDTETESWKRYGDWKLPFFRQAHFDPELDAWVGLSGDLDNFGYLCSCDVLPTTGISKQPPAWKLSKEKMFCQDPAEERWSATLAYMGSRSRFCLLYWYSVIDEDYRDMVVEHEDERPRRHLLRLTSFSLKYDKNGDLQVSTRRQVRCYELPHVVTPSSNDLRAFWM